jgi:hypothetical protein
MAGALVGDELDWLAPLGEALCIWLDDEVLFATALTGSLSCWMRYDLLKGVLARGSAHQDGASCSESLFGSVGGARCGA